MTSKRWLNSLVSPSKMRSVGSMRSNQGGIGLCSPTVRLKVKHFLGLCLILPPWLGWVGYRVATWPRATPRAEWAPLAPELFAGANYTDFNEEVVLAYKGVDMGESQHLDHQPDAIYRLDLRQFLGERQVSLIRVDLDRDSFFDAQFHYDEGGGLTVEWSRGDDEQYDDYLAWTGEGWVATARPVQAGALKTNVSPTIAAVLAWQGRTPSPDQGADITPDTPWRMDLVQSEGVLREVVLDLDRDGFVDQRWNLATDPIAVTVFPSDDDRDGVHYTWNGSRLIPR